MKTMVRKVTFEGTVGKSWESRTARHRTNFPGTPAVFTADFHAQKGCKKGFAIGHVAVG